MRRFLVLGLLCIATLSAYSQDHSRVTIAVAGLFHSNRFTVESVANQPVVLKANNKKEMIGISAPQQVSIFRSGERLLVETPAGAVTANTVELTGTSGDTDFVLIIPGRFRRSYRGTLTISAAENELQPVVSMDLETAVASIVAAEGPPNAPLEALKALAISARSYLVAGAPRHRNVDFCDTTHCQFLRNPPPSTSPAARATAQTHGLVMTFAGKPFAAMYSASCAGRTHTLAELGLPQRDYPYYAVACPYCREHPDHWSSQVSTASAPRGERERIALARQLGWSVIPSNDFQISRTTSGLELSGVGHGHGLGLCERGASAMARGGANFRSILAHYYPNSVIDSLDQH